MQTGKETFEFWASGALVVIVFLLLLRKKLEHFDATNPMQALFGKRLAKTDELDGKRRKRRKKKKKEDEI